MQIQHLRATSTKIARWCYLHLIISVFSFLILVCWGIPFCPISFISNALCGFVLMAFLALCTLILFTEMCALPNGLIIQCTQWLSHTWLAFLQAIPVQQLNLPCAQPSSLILAMVSCATIIVMLLRTCPIKKNCYLIAILITAFWLAGQQPPTHDIDHLPCGKSTLPIIHTAGKLIIVDTGCLGRYLSAPSFVQYTLMPHIIKKYGTNTIDHIILLQPGKLAFDAIHALSQKGFIIHLYIPLWRGPLSKSGLRSFMQMKEQISQRGTHLHRLNTHAMTLIQNEQTTLTIEPCGTEIEKSGIYFRAYCVGHIIDKQPVTFYPAKYDIRNRKTKCERK